MWDKTVPCALCHRGLKKMHQMLLSGQSLTGRNGATVPPLSILQKQSRRIQWSMVAKAAERWSSRSMVALPSLCLYKGHPSSGLNSEPLYLRSPGGRLFVVPHVSEAQLASTGSWAFSIICPILWETLPAERFGRHPCDELLGISWTLIHASKPIELFKLFSGWACHFNGFAVPYWYLMLRRMVAFQFVH